MNEKLATQLKNYKLVLSTLQEQDEMEEPENLSTRIADDLDGQEFVVGGEEEENDVDNLVLGLNTVYYSMQDVE